MSFLITREVNNVLFFKSYLWKILFLHFADKQQKHELLKRENIELKHKLEQTRRAFEKTWAQLRSSNQRKEQIEKDIRQEIYKTHTVLKSARSNIETKSDFQY